MQKILVGAQSGTGVPTIPYRLARLEWVLRGERNVGQQTLERLKGWFDANWANIQI